jgi:hypothetical protein
VDAILHWAAWVATKSGFDGDCWSWFRRRESF